MLDLLEHAANADLVPLGCAIPNAGLLAAGQLDRFLARAARVAGRRYNIYTEPRGDRDLRGEIARRGLRFGASFSPANIAITCGCTEALSLALKAVTRPGDTVAIESPTYFGLLQLLEANGLKALELPTDARAGLVVGALEDALARQPVAACLLSSCFNNPLGCTLSQDDKQCVITTLGRHRVPLIEDDIYGDLYYGDERPTPFIALAPDADIVYCSSFSKTIAPGYRIGWIAAAKHIGRVLEAKFAGTLCGPALPQRAMADFLASGGYDNHLRRMRRTLAGNITLMTAAIDRSFPAETRVSRPDGGFVLWLELPPAVDTRRLYDMALKDGICFAPGEVFTSTDRYRNCLRLSCGDPWDDRIARAIETLGAMANGLAQAAAGDHGFVDQT